MAELQARINLLNLTGTLAEAILEYAKVIDEASLPQGCPSPVTDRSMERERLQGYWDVLGTRHPAVEELFDCPMMNISEGGVVRKPGHATEHYNAYFHGFHVQFDGDEYAPDPSEPGRKLFSVACLFGHCGLYIPYWWIETDLGYNYASVYYCWPELPILQGYLVTSRVASRPSPSLEKQFLDNATRMGLIPAGTELRYRDDARCWEQLARQIEV